MSDQSRFDWRAILQATAIIVGITAVIGLIIPVAGALIDGAGPWDTRNVSGNQIYRWLFWAIGWGLTVWQGSWMLKTVGDRIIDDMLVTSIIVAILLLIVKIIVWLAYEPTAASGDPLLPITGLDAGASLVLLVVALVAARANRY
jgi:hypothetical protein